MYCVYVSGVCARTRCVAHCITTNTTHKLMLIYCLAGYSY